MKENILYSGNILVRFSINNFLYKPSTKTNLKFLIKNKRDGIFHFPLLKMSKTYKVKCNVQGKQTKKQLCFLKLLQNINFAPDMDIKLATVFEIISHIQWRRNGHYVIINTQRKINGKWYNNIYAPNMHFLMLLHNSIFK